MTEEKRKRLGKLLESDNTIRREFLGLQTQLAPFPQHCSTQRLEMLASHVAQAMVVKGAEPPRIFTGMENVIGKYEFSTTRRDQDIRVLAIVPKFRAAAWKHGENMPQITVIYLGLKDYKIHYMDIESYTYLHEKFGYINDRPGIDYVSVGNDIPKDVVITRSPAWRGNDYCMGTNANVVFLNHWATTEDAVVISESLAEKGTNYDVGRVKINLSQNDVMLNLYGDKDLGEYKVLPDIGEVVGPNGLLAAIRPKNSSSYISDMTPDALQRYQPLHDEPVGVPPGAKILDIDVYINYKILSKINDGDSVYTQILNIYNDHQSYYDEIVRRYEEYKSRGMEISEEFNTLVFRAMTMRSGKKYSRKTITLCDTREPIEFINIVVTYGRERKIAIGSKITGREGSRKSK